MFPAVLVCFQRRAAVVDIGKPCLFAQVFYLKLILPAVFDKVRAALPELETHVPADALLPDVQHPVIVEGSGVSVQLSADDDQLHAI